MWRSFKLALPLAVIIGAVVVLSKPACGCSTKEKSFVAAMKSDLRNMAAYQEVVFAETGRYTSLIDSARYRPSALVTIWIVELADSGFAAQAAHDRMAGMCAMWVGNVRAKPLPEVAESREGEPYCGELSPRRS